MRRTITFTIVGLLAVALLVGAIFLWKPNGTAASENKGGDAQRAERKVLYWVDPMHPAYKSNKPGKAPDCGMDLVPVYEGQDAGENFPQGTINISSQRQQLIGVTYGIVEREALSHSIRAVGKITFDETKTARIHPRIEGWIEKVFVDFTGKEVRRGDALLSIYSPELVASQQELLIAVRGREYLGGSKLTEVSDNAVSLYNAARERLRLFEISEEQIAEVEKTRKPIRALTLYAPTGGFVLARNAYEKQRVGPDTELYQIADLSTVWALIDVYEYEAPMMSMGMPVDLRLSYMPGRIFRGRVNYIYPQVDATTRTLKVRLEVPNPRMELKPDMFVEAEIKMDHGRQLMVPTEAVLDSGVEQTVFVAHDGGYFEPRKVKLGAKFGDRVEVLGGLKAGEKIVTSGNFLIDSESKLKSGTDAMGSGAHGSHGGPPANDPKPKDAPKQSPKPVDDHSGHTASPPPAEDHSSHQTNVPAAVQDHSGHRVTAPAAPTNTGHEGHGGTQVKPQPARPQNPAKPADHSGHGAAPEANPHANHGPGGQS